MTASATDPEDVTVDRRVPKVLIVDDDDLFRRAIRRQIQQLGYDVVEASDGEDGLRCLDEGDIDVALVDIHLPDVSGVDVLRGAPERAPHTDYVVVTSSGDMENASHCLNAGASDYLEKPVDTRRLHMVLKRSAEAAAYRRERNFLWGDELDRLLFGHSPQMVQIRHDIRKYGPSRVPVIVEGESGTGKDLVARALHRVSGREGRFVALNCTAISESMFEGELFGWKEGSFTGARGSRDGVLHAARHGTLLLDEIGDMPLPYQVKLLRAVDNREFRPVGADQSRELTARIVGATNRDLQAEVKAGRFRHDLRFRLNVLNIKLPPLRERPGDIKLLTLKFLHKFNLEEQRSIRRVDQAALALLEGYPWPGNVRELHNVLVGAVLQAESDVLTADLLPDYLSTTLHPVPSAGGPTAYDEGLFHLPYVEAKDAATHHFVRAYLRHHLRNHDTVAEAARQAGIEPPNFHRLMKRHGVRADDNEDGGEE